MSEDKTKLASGHDDHFVALHSGFVLGKYELQAVLGQGGFGITYKAWDSELKRAVAIKEYLPSDVAVRVDGSTVRAKSRNDEEGFQWGLERFLDEARALARFDHSQAIVRVYDYTQANGTAYMVMALIDGTPLSAVYRREAPLSEERLKAIVLPILDGLQDVHEAGFLHRDIKPANILIRANGQPVLIDFGAARQALGEKSRSITSVFTPGYAPFEQYTSSGKQGPWTDIYALAATLYHGISGKAPPQATDRIREDPMEPAVRLGAGRYSPQFLAAIDRGLEVFENRRPQNVAHWRDMLSGAIALAVPPMQPGAAPVMPTSGFDAPRTQPSQGGPPSQPQSQPPTAVPTLNEYGVPSQTPPMSQGGPHSQAPQSQMGRAGKGRLGLIAAAVALVLVGGGAAAFFALSPGSSRQGPPADETTQQRAQRLAEEARVAADQARKAQDAAEAEIKRQAEQEARQKAQEEERRKADAALAQKAEQARRDADRAQRENDAEAKRHAEEEARKIAEAEAQRKAESERLEQERKALEAARAKAESELAEARRLAAEARSQADALRAQAEKERLAAEEQRKRQEAEAKARAEQEAKAKAEAKRKAEAEAKAKADAEAKRKAEAEAKARAEQEARQRAQAPAPPPAPAPSAPQQQAAVAPAAPGFAYAGRYRVTIDCPQVDQPPFAQYGTAIQGPQFTWDFYRDGKGTGTISGDSMSYQITFTGRSGNSFKGSFNLRAQGENFRGSGIVAGFGPSQTGERACPIVFEKR